MAVVMLMSTKCNDDTNDSNITIVISCLSLLISHFNTTYRLNIILQLECPELGIHYVVGVEAVISIIIKV